MAGRRPVGRAVAAAALTAGLALFVACDEAGEVTAATVPPLSAAGPTTTTTTTTTATTSEPAAATVPAAELVAVSPDPAYLFHPTVLPAGMDLCAPPTGRSAEFCGDRPGVGVAVRLRELAPQDASAGSAVTEWPEARWIDGTQTATLGVAIEGVMELRVTATGIAETQIIDIARSIPLLGDTAWARVDRDRALDPSGAIPARAAATILGVDPEDVHDGASGWVPRTNPESLRLLVDESPSLLSYAATMLFPRILDDLDVVAVGGTGTGSLEDVSRISWTQRGLVWTLEARRPIDRLAEQVATAVEVIASI